MKKKYIKYSIALILVLGIISIEVFLRKNYYNELSIGKNQNSIFQDDSVIFYTYKPNTIFEVEGKEVQINKDGYIGRDFSPKSPDTFRIAFVGACAVAGSVHQPEYYSFCPMLQEELLKNKYKVEILNCGIDGANRTWENFKSIEYKVLTHKPDLILLEYGLPFFSENAGREVYRDYKFNYSRKNENGQTKGRKMVDNIYRNEWWIKVVCQSYIIRTILRSSGKYLNNEFSRYVELYQRKKVIITGGWSGLKYTMEESAQYIDSLRFKLNQDSIRFFLYGYNKNSDHTSFCKEHKLPLISLGLSFSEDDYFPKDGHWNENGCQKVADRFYELFLKYQIIPQKYTGLQ